MRRRVDNNGVSAIIATILMVAVTVVLAGVLYVMIIGIGGGNNDVPPLGSWSMVDAVNNHSAKLVFGSFSSEVKPIDLKVIIYEEGLNCTPCFTEITIIVPLAGQDDNPCQIIGYNDTEISATYTDYGWESNLVNGGDFIEIDGLVAGKYYTVEVFHVPSQSVLSMTGVSPNFQVPL